MIRDRRPRPFTAAPNRHWRGLLLSAYVNTFPDIFYELLSCYIGKVGTVPWGGVLVRCCSPVSACTCVKAGGLALSGSSAASRTPRHVSNAL